MTRQPRNPSVNYSVGHTRFTFTRRRVVSTTKIKSPDILVPSKPRKISLQRSSGPAQMPARLSSMELSSPSNPDVDASAQPSRRKSGRVHKKPEFLSPGSAGKRKRDARETGDADGGADMNDESEDENDDDADEEELREQRRKKKRVNKDRSRPTAKKKRMANGITLGGSSILVRRPANKAAKSKNASSDAAAEVGGLYGELSR